MEQKTITEAKIVDEGAYQSLWNFVNLIKSWQEKDLDVMIAVTGPKGLGKSTFCIQVAKRYVERFMNKKFTPEEYIAYTFEDLKEKLATLPDFSPLIIDEAVNIAMGEDWARFESKYLKKIFAKLRTRHLIIFLAIPDFWWLDRKYREDMVTFWIHIYARGRACLFTPTLIPGSKDTWHRDWFEKVLKNKQWNWFTHASEIEKYLVKHPCFSDFIIFPKADQDIYEKYLELRKQAIIKEERKTRRFWLSAHQIVQIYELRKKGLTLAEIGRIVGCSQDTVSAVLEEIHNPEPG